MTQRQLAAIQLLFGTGADEDHLSDRLQAAIDLVIDDTAFPGSVGRALNVFFADETLGALRKLQRAFIRSGMKGLSADNFILLVAEGLDGGWLADTEAALALAYLVHDVSPDSPADRLSSIAWAIILEVKEGWLGPQADTIFRDELAKYIDQQHPTASSRTMNQQKAPETEPPPVRVLPSCGRNQLPELLELVKTIPDKEALEWRLLDLDGMHLPDIEELAPGVDIDGVVHAVEASSEGLLVPWADLEQYASRWTIAWLTIEARSVGRHYSLRNFDSSWWDVSSNDQLYLARLRRDFTIAGASLD